MKTIYYLFVLTVGILVGIFLQRIVVNNQKPRNQYIRYDSFLKSDSMFTLIVEDTTFFYKGKVIGNFQFFNYALTKDEIYKITQPKANKKMMKAMKVGECMICEGGMVRIYRTKEGWFTIGPGGSEFMSNELIEQMGL